MKNCTVYPNKAPTSTIFRILHDEDMIRMQDINTVKINNQNNSVTLHVIPNSEESINTIEDIRESTTIHTTHDQCHWAISESRANAMGVLYRLGNESADDLLHVLKELNPDMKISNCTRLGAESSTTYKINFDSPDLP